MTDLRKQLAALHAQLMAAAAQVEAILDPEEQPSDGSRCPRCGNEELDRHSTLAGETFLSCRCGWIEGQEEKA